MTHFYEIISHLCDQHQKCIYKVNKTCLSEGHIFCDLIVFLYPFYTKANFIFLYILKLCIGPWNQQSNYCVMINENNTVTLDLTRLILCAFMKLPWLHLKSFVFIPFVDWLLFWLRNISVHLTLFQSVVSNGDRRKNIYW